MEKPNAVKVDLYQETTDTIIALLEQGVAPWKRTWNQYGLARNYATGHIYSGINLILMNNTGHPVPYFMTFNQVKSKQGSIKSGAKARRVIYYDAVYKDQDGTVIPFKELNEVLIQERGIRKMSFIKYTNVFNIDDIDGITFDIKEIRLKENEKILQCEHIIESMPNPPRLQCKNANDAFYIPSEDAINMPKISQFHSSEHYYATFFHELVHATGHQSRLNRPGITDPNLFGSTKYGIEELIAEMGASFLCAFADINYDAITENSAAYISGWLSVLKEDKYFVLKAAGKASRAVGYITKTI